MTRSDFGRGVTPVVSSLLLVTIVLVLASVTAVMTLGLGSELTESGPAITFDQKTEAGAITFTHTSGEAVEVEQLRAVGGKIIESSVASDKLQAGDKIQIAPTEDEVRLVWKKQKEASILASVEGPFGPLGGSKVIEIVEDGRPLSEGSTFDAGNRDTAFTLRYPADSDKPRVRFKVEDENAGKNGYVKTFSVKPSREEYELKTVLLGCQLPDGGTITEIRDNPSSGYDVEIDIDIDC